MPGAWMAGIVAILFAGTEPQDVPRAEPAIDPAPVVIVQDAAPRAAAQDAVDEPDEEEETALVRAEPAPSPALPRAPGGRPLAEDAPVVLQRVERPDGTALERVLEPSGEVVLHEVTRAGTVLSCTTVGRLLAMRVVEQRDAADGEIVQVVRDASGTVLQYVVGADGEPRGLTVLAPAAR
jgi:hypothetical protein